MIKKYGFLIYTFVLTMNIYSSNNDNNLNKKNDITNQQTAITTGILKLTEELFLKTNIGFFGSCLFSGIASVDTGGNSILSAMDNTFLPEGLVSAVQTGLNVTNIFTAINAINRQRQERIKHFIQNAVKEGFSSNGTFIAKINTETLKTSIMQTMRQEYKTLSKKEISMCIISLLNSFASGILPFLAYKQKTDKMGNWIGHSVNLNTTNAIFSLINVSIFTEALCKKCWFIKGYLNNFESKLDLLLAENSLK